MGRSWRFDGLPEGVSGGFEGPPLGLKGFRVLPGTPGSFGRVPGSPWFSEGSGGAPGLPLEVLGGFDGAPM
eukprot:3251453-Pyramimonas_sp.AAC.1